MNKFILFGFFYVYYLATFKGSGFSIDAMRFFGFARVFINVELRHFQRIMSAALTGA